MLNHTCMGGELHRTNGASRVKWAKSPLISASEDTRDAAVRAAPRSGLVVLPGSFPHYCPTTSMPWPEVAATTSAGKIAWGNRGCISWPFSGPSEPPCRTAAIDRSCTTCAARGRSGSSVTAAKPVRVKNLNILPAPLPNGDGAVAICSKSCPTTRRPYAAAAARLRTLSIRDAPNK